MKAETVSLIMFKSHSQQLTVVSTCLYPHPSPAGLPPAHISTKWIKSVEGEAKTETGEEEKRTEENVWPEPPKRFAPTVRVASVLPDDVTCPDGCKRLNASQDVDPLIVSKLR